MSEPEFDRYSGSYEHFVSDPIRDRFTGEESNFFHVPQARSHPQLL